MQADLHLQTFPQLWDLQVYYVNSDCPIPALSTCVPLLQADSRHKLHSEDKWIHSKQRLVTQLPTVWSGSPLDRWLSWLTISGNSCLFTRPSTSYHFSTPNHCWVPMLLNVCTFTCLKFITVTLLACLVRLHMHGIICQTHCTNCRLLVTLRNIWSLTCLKYHLCNATLPMRSAF